MPMSLPFATNIQTARAAAAELPGSQNDYFASVAREMIAQAILTLSVKRGTDWTSADLIEQFDKPRKAFEASGLEDGRANIILFDVEQRQHDSGVIAAINMAHEAFGHPYQDGSNPRDGIAA